MTTASAFTNDHAALLSTIGGAAGVAPQLPPMQLSGALDTTACTTYDGALFGISAEMTKRAKDRKDPPMSCLSRHQQVKMSLDYGVGFKARMEAGLVFDEWQDARHSYVLLVKEAADIGSTASV